MGLLDKVKKGKKTQDTSDSVNYDVVFDEGYDDIEEEDYSQEVETEPELDSEEGNTGKEKKPKKGKKVKSSKLSVDADEEEGFLTSDEKKGLRETVTRQDVELDSEEQRQVLEREKLNELAEDMKYNDTKKPISYIIFKILNTTPLTTLILYYIIFVMLNSIYLVFITQNTVIALLLALVMSAFMVNSFVIKRNEMKRYMNNLFQLSGYATTLVHYIKSGNGITYAYNQCWKSIEGDVRYDIRRTLTQLEKDASLETESFKRYSSKNIVVFHRILAIWYLENSSNAGEMFSSVLKDLSMEVEKKNELIARKNTKAMTLYMMAGIALGIPAISAFITGENYDVFMSAVTSQYLLGVYYVIMAWTVIKINDSTTEARLD